MSGSLHVGAEDAGVEVFGVAGAFGSAGHQAERTTSVGQPLGPQEQRLVAPLGVQGGGEVVQVGDEGDPDAGIEQRADDMPGDL